MNVMAAIVRTMPVMTLVVTGSPNAMAPTRMAVIGSKTPRTDAFVAPIRRVATARVAVDTIVGRTARPVRLAQAETLSSEEYRRTDKQGVESEHCARDCPYLGAPVDNYNEHCIGKGGCP